MPTASGILAVQLPPIGWCAPFVALLLLVAVLPLCRATVHWWEHNRNKLLVGVVLGVATLAHYHARGFGVIVHDEFAASVLQASGLHVEIEHGHPVTGPGLAAAAGALGNAAMEYLPFIILLFTLYCISGGIAIRGDIPAHPTVNAAFLAVGGLLASVIGTTGASMVLIRPLLQTNSERRLKAHTLVFFIFIVSNVGGCLLPIGDPPLFLGYLRGVPFLWTLCLWREWAMMMVVLLVIYLIWDTLAYRRESLRDLVRDETRIQRIKVLGGVNFVWLVLAVIAVGTLDPSKPVPGTEFRPPPLMREGVLLLLTAVSFLSTPRGLRAAARFNFTAIAEVAALFIGIFLTMQVPIEILNARGAELGLTRPVHFFWATGALSSFLDNAPTYVVFFETANAMTHAPGPGIFQLLDGNFIRQDLLEAISLGAVFMGANTYIGNGPNFMVKSIAESHGVKMPSFFGYMIYSSLILLPFFVLLSVAILPPR